MSKGIIVAQEGINIERASDYQKVLDSRWLFMEVGNEIEATVTLPSIGTPTAFGYQRVNIARHGLTRKGKPYIPAFHGSYKVRESYNPNDMKPVLAADDTFIYVYRTYAAGSPSGPYTIDVKAQVYTLPILEDYLAPKEVGPKSAKSSSRYGLRALDGSDSSVKIGDTSSHGFSVDTRKKILSVHKVTRKKVNYWIYNQARVTAVDTTTDTLTLDVSPTATGPPEGGATGITWVATGVEVTYRPGDFVTYPSPLSSSLRVYLIKVDDTHVKLALSQADAQAGVAINLTTGGSLPARIDDAGTADDWRVDHENEYPPSYFFCDIIQNVSGAGQAVGSLFFTSTSPLVRSDNNYLYFTGVQSTYTRNIAIIILKDPIEVAG